MNGRLTNINDILDRLDEVADRDPAAARRRSSRRRWRKPLKIRVWDPGGNVRWVEVVAQNLSSGGMCFINLGYLHIGSRCELQLVTTDNAWVDVQATVVRCRHVAGLMHEVGLRFDHPVEEDLFVSRSLAASILLVDEDEVQARLTEHVLGKAGAEVVRTGLAAEAMKLLAERAFDLVLLDIEVPGISGPQVAQKVREKGVAIPIIIFTANDDPSVREECLAAGCSEVLIKPLGRTELIDTVASFLAADEPIVSKHAGNPEMAEFIHDFVIGLPARIQEMQQFLQARDGQRLASRARQLKAAASDSGVGFGKISDAADRLAKSLVGNVDWTLVEKAVRALRDLADRVKETV